MVVHAVTAPMMQLAVDARADILLHIPMKERISRQLAQQIARQGVCVVPTLVMMEAFSKALFFGYKRADYTNAEKNVQLLHSLGVPILVGTDANSSFFVPKIEHVAALHREMELLMKAGLSPLEILRGATNKTAKAFGMKGIGTITPGDRATLVMLEGRHDKIISDITRLKQIWIDGLPILGEKTCELSQ